jgi:large subunit ribosomal protein L2
MALKTFNPTSPGRRQLVAVDRSALHKGKPVKQLTEGLTSKGGRNNTGRITMRRRGGGVKRTYRIIDFKRRAKPTMWRRSSGWNMIPTAPPSSR